VAQALGGLAGVRLREGAFDAAAAQVDEALAVTDALGDRGLAASLLLMRGVVEAHRGRDLAALHQYELGLAAYRAANNRRGEGIALVNLAVSSQNLGRFADARMHLDAALEIHRVVGSVKAAAAAHCNLAAVCVDLGELDEAEEHAALALQSAQHVGSVLMGWVAAQLEANVLHARGRSEAARWRLHDALLGFKELQAPRYRVGVLRDLVDLERQAGRLEEAERHLDQAETLAEPLGDSVVAALLSCSRADLRLAAGTPDLPGALDSVAQLRGTRRRADLAIGLCMLGRTRMAVGQDGAAEEQEATALLEELSVLPTAPSARALGRLREMREGLGA
jgi:tetratricopeptide (TPR) repeat protein